MKRAPTDAVDQTPDPEALQQAGAALLAFLSSSPVRLGTEAAGIAPVANMDARHAPGAERRSAYLDVRDVAARLNVSPGLVRRLVERGEIPHHRFGRLVKIDQADVDAYLVQSRRIGEATRPTMALKHLRPITTSRRPRLQPLQHLRPPEARRPAHLRAGGTRP